MNSDINIVYNVNVLPTMFLEKIFEIYRYCFEKTNS